MIERTVRNLLEQDYENFEIIINDDNSPDGTEDICLRIASEDSRVRYFKNKTNLRYAGNQNAALSRARAEYCAIVHDGDYYNKGLIRQWMSLMVKYPTAALAFCALEEGASDGSVRRICTHPYSEFVPGVSLTAEMLGRLDSPIFGIALVRKSMIASVGSFDTQFPVLADIDMWLRLLRRYDAVYIKEPLIKTYAREKDHANGVINWSIRRELDTIKKNNIASTFDQFETAHKIFLKKHVSDMNRHHIWCIFWCVKHLELKKLLGSVNFALVYFFENWGSDTTLRK